MLSGQVSVVVAKTKIYVYSCLGNAEKNETKVCVGRYKRLFKFFYFFFDRNPLKN